MSSALSNKRLINGIYGMNILSVAELAAISSYVSDSNQVPLNELTLVTDFLSIEKPNLPEAEYQRKFSNAKSAFNSLKGALEEELNRSAKICGEAEIALRVLFHSYYYKPELGDPEKVNELIFSANKKGLFDEQKF